MKNGNVYCIFIISAKTIRTRTASTEKTWRDVNSRLLGNTLSLSPSIPYSKILIKPFMTKHYWCNWTQKGRP